MKRTLILIGLLLLGSVGHTQSNFTGNAQVYHGQQSVTNTATALASQALKTFCVKALHGNGAAIYIGNSGVTTSNGMELVADQSWCANIDNANRIYVVNSGGSASVSWIGTN